jgi:hypothetical protein
MISLREYVDPAWWYIHLRVRPLGDIEDRAHRCRPPLQVYNFSTSQKTNSIPRAVYNKAKEVV